MNNLARKVAVEAAADFKDEVNARARIMRVCRGMYDYYEAVEIVGNVKTDEAFKYMMLHCSQPVNHRHYMRTLADTILMMRAFEAYKNLEG
ncbi:MAG: hypothetical protein GY899_12960 [Verrucomicrobiaceae bacterium]|nr:hypothetical protein [Verrucomicrobiaceae bacterium]